MKLTPKQKLLGAPIIFFCIVLIERFLLSDLFPSISKVIKIDWEFILFRFPIPLPQFGLISILIIIYGAYAIWLIPFRTPFNLGAWKIAASRWWRALIISCLIPIFMILGAFFYALVKSNIPGWAQTILESFGIAFTPTICGTAWSKLDGSLTTMAGLLIGAYVVYRLINKK
jgi:hypothetical protein